MTSIKKAVVPIAGIGSRMLPVTRAVPKELLPVNNKPLLQYALEELCLAGIEEVCFVLAPEKANLLKYFIHEDVIHHSDITYLEHMIDNEITINFCLQNKPLGLANALYQARYFIGKDDFLLLLPDDHIKNNQMTYGAGELVEHFTNTKKYAIAVEEVPDDKTSLYGIVQIDNNNVIQSIVEKPLYTDVESRLAVIGRYILPAKIINIIEGYLNDNEYEKSFAKVLNDVFKIAEFQAVKLKNERFDCGEKTGLILANISYHLDDKSFLELIRKMIPYE